MLGWREARQRVSDRWLTLYNRAKLRPQQHLCALDVATPSAFVTR